MAPRKASLAVALLTGDCGKAQTFTKVVCIYMKALFWLAALLVSPQVFAHDDEPNLRLSEVGAFQVSGSVMQPPEMALSLTQIQAPFIATLQKLGKTIDQNNYSNVVGSEIEITSLAIKRTTVYAVKVSFHYTEPCTSTRLGFATTCALWERYELPKIVNNPQAASLYVMKAIAAAAEAFAAEFRRH